MDPDAAVPLLVLASCPVPDRPDGAPRLWGKLKIKINPASLAYSIYQQTEIEEAFNCSYELNPEYQDIIEADGLKFGGATGEGGVRIIELPDHPFFIATGFMPQFTSEEDRPHPLIVAYLEAVINLKNLNKVI
jgi:CTP synthase (UTP-ammonia lyase)